MTLKEQLETGGMAVYIRDATDEHLNVFTKSNGKGYWLTIVKGSKKTPIDCASFEDLVSKLNAGEAESPEWFDI